MKLFGTLDFLCSKHHQSRLKLVENSGGYLLLQKRPYKIALEILSLLLKKIITKEWEQGNISNQRDRYKL